MGVLATIRITEPCDEEFLEFLLGDVLSKEGYECLSAHDCDDGNRSLFRTAEHLIGNKPELWIELLPPPFGMELMGFRVRWYELWYGPLPGSLAGRAANLVRGFSKTAIRGYVLQDVVAVSAKLDEVGAVYEIE